jgi:hypothetical protein
MKPSVRALFLLAGWPVLACSQTQPWLEGAAHLEFRQRVIDLAMIYGESSGIDTAGWRIEARQLRPLPQHCAWVEVKVSQGTAPARREEVRACAHELAPAH